MRRLDTSAVASGIELPIKVGTLEFLQDAYYDIAAAFVKMHIPNPQTGTVYVLAGLEKRLFTSPFLGYLYNSGWIYYNGDLLFCGGIFNTPNSTPDTEKYIVISTSQFTTHADPVTFTDGIARNIHNVKAATMSFTNPSNGIPAYSAWVRVGAWIPKDTKTIHATAAYVAAQFDGTGLGLATGERYGWAVCNGNNGTVNVGAPTAPDAGQPTILQYRLMKTF